MLTPAKLLLAGICLVGAASMLIHAERSLQASVPADMPGDSSFASSGYDIAHNEFRGSWVACRYDAGLDQDWCRVTDAHGAVVYQGGFLPVNSTEPVDQGRLRVKSIDAKRMWVRGPIDQAPVPVIPLKDGNVLVPAAERSALVDRWQSQPEEFEQIVQGG